MNKYTYKVKPSNVLTEYKGEFGSFCCISTSFLLSTKPFLIIFCNKLASAGLNESASSSLLEELCWDFDSTFCAISSVVTLKILFYFLVYR